MNFGLISFRKMASASVLKRLTQRAEQAEQIIHELKSTIDILKQNAAISISKPEEVRLRKENEQLRQKIESLKVQLVMAEIKNGVKQVPLPVQRSVAVTGQAPPTESEKPAQQAEVKVEEKPKKQQKDKKPKDAQAAGEGAAKKGKGGGGGSAPAAEEKMDVSRLCFKVGKIVEVEKHPDADTLYIEKVDLGEEAPRTVVSGLVKFVPIEEMQNRVAVFMINLKPAKMRGVLSQAMIMCASTPEKVEILKCPAGAEIGDVVIAEGYEGTPDKQLNPKKKVWETLKPDLRTDGGKVATYKGAALCIPNKGKIVAPSLASVQIQ